MGDESTASSFDVTRERWIGMSLVDGDSGEVSIREAFHRADEIRDIRSELGTQTFAILRLLLAILYRVRPDGVTVAEWTRWWTDGLPLEDIDDYLDQYADRFDLLDPERPFMQVADLRTAGGEIRDVTPLIFDLPTRNRLFSTRAGEGAASLSYAEATRWLVNVHGFDVSGIHPGAVGDPRMSGGKVYPKGIGVAWAGLLGGVYAIGANLRETLLLNLVPPGHGVAGDVDTDIPPWEEGDPDGPAARDGLLPSGPVRLLAWQSRRVRLVADGGRITGSLVCYGDPLTPQNLDRFEAMTAWRFSEPQTRAAKQTTYMPREHLPDRALWRGIGSLIPGVAPLVPKRDAPASKEPGVVIWLREVEELVGSRSARLRLRAVGVVYGSNNSVIDDVIEDEVTVHLSLLSERNRPLALQAVEAVRLADEGVSALRHLAENIERAGGGTGDGALASEARRRGYSELDAPYRAWLGSLDDATDPVEAITAWKTLTRDILRRLGDELVAQASAAAWVGRVVSRAGRSDLITAPRAAGWFARSLTRTFGSATPQESTA